MFADSNKEVLERFAEALENKDIERVLSLCSREARWITPEGEFNGSEGIRRYLEWFFENTTGIMNSGIGIIAMNDSGASEHVLEGANEGENWEVTAISAYRLSRGKIESIITTYDRLSVAKQVASGGIAGLAVSTIVDRMEEGLH